jgi:hypothetical protein
MFVWPHSHRHNTLNDKGKYELTYTFLWGADCKNFIKKNFADTFSTFSLLSTHLTPFPHI